MSTNIVSLFAAALPAPSDEDHPVGCIEDILARQPEARFTVECERIGDSTWLKGTLNHRHGTMVHSAARIDQLQDRFNHYIQLCFN